jgi:DNA-binding NarL/FixJ family response regulator
MSLHQPANSLNADQVAKNRALRSRPAPAARSRKTPGSPAQRPRLSAKEWSVCARQWRLTEQDLKILKLTYNGQTAPIIASELDLSAHTVRKHQRHLLAKMGLRRFIDAIPLIHAFLNAQRLSGANNLKPICYNFANGLCPHQGRALKLAKV